MIGTLAVSNTAFRQNVKLQTFYAFIGSPSNIRVRDLPAAIGDWDIDAVYVKANYPDNNTYTVECTNVDDIWVGTLPASTSIGISQNGYQILADGTDEKGNQRTGYVLGAGDLEILDSDNQTAAGEHQILLSLKNELPDNPSTGDIAKDIDGLYKIWQNDQWNALGQSLSKIDHITDDIGNSLSANGDVIIMSYNDWLPNRIDLDENYFWYDIIWNDNDSVWQCTYKHYNEYHEFVYETVDMLGADRHNREATSLLFPDFNSTPTTYTVDSHIDKVVLSGQLDSVLSGNITIKNKRDIDDYKCDWYNNDTFETIKLYHIKHNQFGEDVWYWQNNPNWIEEPTPWPGVLAAVSNEAGDEQTLTLKSYDGEQTHVEMVVTRDYIAKISDVMRLLSSYTHA